MRIRQNIDVKGTRTDAAMLSREEDRASEIGIINCILESHYW